MAYNSSLYLIPLVIAWFVLVLAFYFRDNAVSRLSLSFILAVLSMLMLLSYLVMSVVGALPPYMGIAFGGTGTLFFLIGLLLLLRV
jgi:hypothetical protein